MIEFNDKSLDNYWKRIAINCKQIKSLKLNIGVDESLLINDSILSILKQYKRLKRLNLQLYHKHSEEPFFSIYPLKDFKGFEGLTHLSIAYPLSTKTFYETILTDIDINFPKLQYFKICCPFRAGKWTPQVLSQLSDLQTIELAIKNEKTIPFIERHLIRYCKHFKKFNKLDNSSDDWNEDSDIDD